jgi:hypothetical protein
MHHCSGIQSLRVDAGVNVMNVGSEVKEKVAKCFFRTVSLLPLQPLTLLTKMSTIRVFVTSADTHSERRFDLNTTIGNLKV